MSLLRGECFCCCFDVLYAGLRIMNLQFFILNNKYKFSSCKFCSSFWSSKFWIRIRVDIKCWIRMRIRIRIETNAGPKHCFFLLQSHCIKLFLEGAHRSCQKEIEMWRLKAFYYWYLCVIPQHREDLILRGLHSSSFWLPRNLFHHMDRETRIGHTVLLVKSRELAGRGQTLPLWPGGRREVKTTENKKHWFHCLNLSC
jgi:hypothetical protein